MSALHQARCFNHALREAVARCPSCRRFFCRECVTEHDGRLTCAGCLTRAAGGTDVGGHPWRVVTGLLKGLAGFVVLWIGFHVIGQFLLQIPAEIHEDVLWREQWWDDL